MGHRIGYADWAALGLAMVAFVAFLFKLTVAGQVSDLQQQASQRQQQIASANVLGQVNNQLIRMLVETAANSGDRDIRGLLEQNGIRFDVRQPNSAATPRPTDGTQP